VGTFMKIGVCGIACEACPSRVRGTCPNGEAGCRPKENLKQVRQELENILTLLHRG